MRVPRSKHTADEMRRILEAALSLPAGMKRREGAHARLQNDLAELGDRLGYFAQTEWDIDLECARPRAVSTSSFPIVRKASPARHSTPSKSTTIPRENRSRSSASCSGHEPCPGSSSSPRSRA